MGARFPQLWYQPLAALNAVGMLLDAVAGASLALSASRQLSTAYSGPLVRLRRSSDDAESDFSATPNRTLDVAAVAVWAGADTLYIRTLYDQSGAAKDVTQSVKANQPKFILSAINGRPVVRFVGASSNFLNVPAIDLTGTNGVTLYVVANNDGGNNIQMIYEDSTNIASFTDGFGLNVDNVLPNGISFGLKGNTGFSSFYPDTPLVTMPAIITATGDKSLATNETSVRVNGVTTGGTRVFNTNNTNNFGNRASYIGARAGTSLFLTGDLGDIILYPTAQDAATMSLVESNINAGYSGFFTQATQRELVPVAADFADNKRTTDDGNFIKTDVYSRLTFTTTADALDVFTYNDMYNTIGIRSSASVNVKVNGVDYANLVAVGAGNTTQTTDLPEGSKVVQIVNGPQIKPGSVVGGMFTRGVSFRGGSIPAFTAPAATSYYVVVGDSIASGFYATNNPQQAWAILLRADALASGRALAVDAWADRALYDDANTAPLRAAFVAHIAAFSPTVVILALGTNDYGLNAQSAANFGTMYAAVLDDLHTSLPSAAIYCLTPILRVSPSVETANTFGNTLDDYRTQISNAQGARSGYATLINGKTILSAGASYNADGLHPSTAGHALMRSAIKTAVGL